MAHVKSPVASSRSASVHGADYLPTEPRFGVHYELLCMERVERLRVRAAIDDPGGDVLPEIDESIDIELRDVELMRDVFRSGGPGGQLQNKTESGVRYTHLPTGISAESRSDRSGDCTRAHPSERTRSGSGSREHRPLHRERHGIEDGVAGGCLDGPARARKRGFWNPCSRHRA